MRDLFGKWAGPGCNPCNPAAGSLGYRETTYQINGVTHVSPVTPENAQIRRARIDEFEERAAIRQYDGGQPRPQAELEAQAELG